MGYCSNLFLVYCSDLWKFPPCDTNNAYKLGFLWYKSSYFEEWKIMYSPCLYTRNLPLTTAGKTSAVFWCSLRAQSDGFLTGAVASSALRLWGGRRVKRSLWVYKNILICQPCDISLIWDIVTFRKAQCPMELFCHLNAMCMVLYPCGKIIQSSSIFGSEQWMYHKS